MTSLYPIFALVLLTVLMYLLLLFSRIISIRNGELSTNYFQLFQGAETPPEYVLKTTRNVANLFEAPVLFYLACVISILISYESKLFLVLAWVYVASRLAHSIIHLTYNNVLHRLSVFLVSQGALVIMWVLLFIAAP